MGVAVPDTAARSKQGARGRKRRARVAPDRIDPQDAALDGAVLWQL